MSDGEVLPIIPVPKYRKAKVSVWRDIGVAETDHVLRLSSVDEAKAFLMETLGVKGDVEGKYLIVLDLFYYALQFCKENSFNSEKTSCLLSILKQTHEMATETPFGNLRETLEFFKDLILCHSVHRPPFSLGIFSSKESNEVLSYFIDSYFRHFKLYKYIFTPQVQLDLTLNYTKFPKAAKSISIDSKSNANEESSNKYQLNDDTYRSVNEIDTDRSQPAQQQATVSDPTNRAAAPTIDPLDVFDPHSESINELKRMIRERLVVEIHHLQAGVQAQLHQSDEVIGKLASDTAGAAAKKQQPGKKKK